MSLLILVSVLVLLSLYFMYKPPFFLFRYFQFHHPSILFHIPLPQSKELIALTIDDAPSEYTSEIMEILAANRATARFFTIGSQVPGREDILRDIVRKGHELGNHAMYDEAPTSLSAISLSDETLVSQIKSVEEMIDQAYASTSQSPPGMVFRPESGFFYDRMQKVVQPLGYRMVLGRIFPHDTQIQHWSVNAWYILSMLRSGGIVICHDRTKWTAPMLRRVLLEMKLQVYRAVSVSELLDEARAQSKLVRKGLEDRM